MRTQPLQAVERAIQILMLLNSEEDVRSVETIARATGISKSAAHRFLVTLEEAGAVIRGRNGGYQLGMLMAELGSRVIVDEVLTAKAFPLLMELTGKYAESTYVVVREDNRSRTVAYVPAYRSVSEGRRRGARLPLGAGAGGKLLLAATPRAELVRLVAGGRIEPLGRASKTAADKLMRELEQIRRDRYALCRDEFQPGVTAIAVPIVDLHGEWIAAMGFSIPSRRFTPQFLELALHELRRASKTITASFKSRGASAAGSNRQHQGEKEPARP
jgi:DNA-binding IclR family transcriptional regulator